MGLFDIFKQKAQDPEIQQKVKSTVQNQMNKRRTQSSGSALSPGMAGYPYFPGDPLYGQLFWPQGVPGDYDGDGIPDSRGYDNQGGDSSYTQGTDPDFDPNGSGPAPDGQDYSQDQYSGDGSSDTGGSDYSNDDSSFDQGGYDSGSGGDSYSDSGSSGSDYGSSYDTGGYSGGGGYDGGGSSYDSGGGGFDSGGGGF